MRGKEDPNSKIGEDASKWGEQFWALNGIDLEIKKGEALGIIGMNGAGKSTLLKILSRVTAPTEGEVEINGRVSSMLEVGTGFHGELTGRENIYLNGAILGMTKKEVDSKMEEIIEFSECRQFIDTPVKRYSSGMYVKLAFSVAAHLDADIMIMDEVLAVGDMKFQEKCLGKMGDAAGKEGKTVLYVSHNMNTIRQLCTRCVVLDHGRIIFDGDVESAIDVYMDRDKSDLKICYNLDTAKRPTPEHGSLVRVTELEFHGREHAVFYSNEPVRFRIRWKAVQNFKDLCLFFTVLYADSTIAGTTQSEAIGDAVKDQEGTAFLEFDVSNLAAGVYNFQVDLFVKNDYGNIASYDHPLTNIHFEVVDSEMEQSRMTWIHKYHGNVKLNDIVRSTDDSSN